MNDSQRAVAIVTGGSRGIGRACVLELARRGWDVAVFYRNNAAAFEATQAACAEDDQATAATVRGFAVDVSDETAVRAGFRRVVDELGARPTAVVCSSGVTEDGLAATMSARRFEGVLRTNLVGSFFVCRESLKAMRRSGGSIVLLSSTAGLRGNVGQVNYAASKGGINAMTHALAREAAPLGIRVNAVAPGFTDTDMLRQMDRRALAAMLPLVPLGRAGRPEEIAKAAAFLAGRDSSYVTGVVLPVDGGLVS